MVLATEMSKHFEHLSKFVNKFSDEKATIPVKVNFLYFMKNIKKKWKLKNKILFYLIY
jgi:hypothetical protein